MISLPSILKRFTNLAHNTYEFPDAEDIVIEEPPKPAPPPAPSEEAKAPGHAVQSPIDYARVQADAILEEARSEAEKIKEQTLLAAEEELEMLREEARAEGQARGFAEGMAGAMTEAKARRDEQAVAQAKEVAEFLQEAARARDEMMEQTKQDLKDLALAIAEKVIQVSLRSSGDILLRMIDQATERHKRREWAHIYIAGCDAKSMAYTIPELTAALSHISDRVRIIPMADDESGTCIIELPDEIIDASVSTQLENIRDVLSSAGTDKGGE